mmetsp:Transcript_3608/g.10385  ORF Transcript_3608/g.10385 Transcript_3608/m.10385 type:complete len:785 (-) Transcript_3608:123-2477(-)
MERRLQERIFECHKLEERLAEKDRQLQGAMEEHIRLDHQMASCTARRGSSDSGEAAEDGGDHSSSLLQEAKRTEEGCAKLRAQIDELLDALEEERQEHDMSKAAVTISKNRELELLHEAKEAADRQQELQQELGAAAEELADTRAEVRRLELELEEASQMKNTDEEEGSNRQRELEESRSAAELLRERNGALEEQLQEGRRVIQATEAELLSTKAKLDEAKAGEDDVAPVESQQGSKHGVSEQERALRMEVSRLIEQRETCEARCNVLSRELHAADTQMLQLRKQLKGSGMMSETEVAELKRQLVEAHEEVRFLKDRSIFLEEEALREVHTELATVRASLADARRAQKAAMQEEVDARQAMARNLRRALADLQEERLALREEVDALQLSLPARPPPAPANGKHGTDNPGRDLPWECSMEFMSPEEKIRELQLRNRQLQFEGRMLEARHQTSPTNTDERQRLLEEARKVHAESEWRLHDTLAISEDQLYGGQATGSAVYSNAPLVIRAETEGAHYRLLKARIEELEERLKQNIDKSMPEKVAESGPRDPAPASNHLEELLQAQREVSEALKKLAASQAVLQERQLSQEERQERIETRRSLDIVHATRKARAASSSNPASPTASFSDWSTPSMVPTHISGSPAASYSPYPSNRPPPLSTSLLVSTHGNYYAPPSHQAADLPGPPLVATPGAGVLLTNLNRFAPPSWRMARGLSPAPGAAAAGTADRGGSAPVKLRPPSPTAVASTQAGVTPHSPLTSNGKLLPQDSDDVEALLSAPSAAYRPSRLP